MEITGLEKYLNINNIVHEMLNPSFLLPSPYTTSYLFHKLGIVIHSKVPPVTSPST